MISQKFNLTVEPKTHGSFTITIDKGSRLPKIPQEWHADHQWKVELQKMLRSERLESAIAVAKVLDSQATFFQSTEGPNQTTYEFRTPRFGHNDLPWAGYGE